MTPVLLEFHASQRAQAVWLSNTSQRPLHAQARLQVWSQDEGQDALAPTTALVASPPLVEIPPGQTQVVRVVRMGMDRPQKEMSYRLLVDELPGPEAVVTGAKDAPSQGVRFLFRYSIPVFVGPQTGTDARNAPLAPPARDAVSARMALDDDKLARLTIRNTGPRRVKLSDMSYVDTAGERLALGNGLFGYVLAGQTRHWTVPSGCRITAVSDMDFGILASSLSSARDQSASLTLRCPSGTQWQVDLGQGNHYASMRRMGNGMGGTIGYLLYRDAARTQLWGSTSGGGTVAGTGTGSPVVVPIYGRLPAQGNVATGSYMDTVVVTLTY